MPGITFTVKNNYIFWKCSIKGLEDLLGGERGAISKCNPGGYDLTIFDL